MNSIQKFLNLVVDFQEHCNQRGYELLQVLGVDNIKRRYTNIDFEKDGVVMEFTERRSTDCPETETVCLKIPELESTEDEWSLYLETRKKEKEEIERNKRQWETQHELEKLKNQVDLLNKQIQDLKGN